MVLHDAVSEALCRTVCDWAGLPPLTEAEAAQRTREMRAMVDNAGMVGPPNWAASLLRWRTEQWLRQAVRRIRDGGLAVPEGSPAWAVAHHRDENGRLLHPVYTAEPIR